MPCRKCKSLEPNCRLLYKDLLQHVDHTTNLAMIELQTPKDYINHFALHFIGTLLDFIATKITAILRQYLASKCLLSITFRGKTHVMINFINTSAILNLGCKNSFKTPNFFKKIMFYLEIGNKSNTGLTPDFYSQSSQSVYIM